MGSFISHAMASSSLPDPTIMESKFASLPPEILTSILDRLSLVDRIRFGIVCSSFLSALRQCMMITSSSSSSSCCLPWLLLPDKSTDTTIAFFSITDRKMYKIPHHPAQSSYLWLGSSQGWLVAIDQGTSLIYLFNPLTRSRIQLPALVTPDSSHEPLCLEFSKAILSWNYNSSSSSSSSSSGKGKGKGYAVVLLLVWPSSTWPNSTMLCAHDGDEAWTPFGSTKDVYMDASFHNGQFYTMQSNGTVETWDLISTAGNTTPSMTSVIMPRQLSLIMSSTRYLVSSQDGILQVCISSPHLTRIDFKIFKLDNMSSNINNKEEEEEECWVEMESLGDRLVILNGYCSMSVSSYPHHFGSNCIIFDRLTPGGKKNRETMLLRMEDKSLKKLLHTPYQSKSPIWITPSLI